MGCGPAANGKIRSAGVFIVNITFSTRTPGSIRCESATPVMKQTAATAGMIQFLLISKLPTTEHQIGRAPFGPREWQTSDSVEERRRDCAARTRNSWETSPTNWQTTA